MSVNLENNNGELPPTPSQSLTFGDKVKYALIAGSPPLVILGLIVGLNSAVAQSEMNPNPQSASTPSKDLSSKEYEVVQATLLPENSTNPIEVATPEEIIVVQRSEPTPWTLAELNSPAVARLHEIFARSADQIAEGAIPPASATPEATRPETTPAGSAPILVSTRPVSEKEAQDRGIDPYEDQYALSTCIKRNAVLAQAPVDEGWASQTWRRITTFASDLFIGRTAYAAELAIIDPDAALKCIQNEPAVVAYLQKKGWDVGGLTTANFRGSAAYWDLDDFIPTLGLGITKEQIQKRLGDLITMTFKDNNRIEPGLARMFDKKEDVDALRRQNIKMVFWKGEEYIVITQGNKIAIARADCTNFIEVEFAPEVTPVIPTPSPTGSPFIPPTESPTRVPDTVTPTRPPSTESPTRVPDTATPTREATRTPQKETVSPTQTNTKVPDTYTPTASPTREFTQTPQPPPGDTATPTTTREFTNTPQPTPVDTATNTPPVVPSTNTPTREATNTPQTNPENTATPTREATRASAAPTTNTPVPPTNTPIPPTAVREPTNTPGREPTRAPGS